MKRHRLTLGLLLLFGCVQLTAVAQTRDDKVHADRDKIADDARWIYNDLPAGFAEAKASGKPLLIVFR